MKKTYQSPSTDMFSFRLEGQLLGGVSAGTKDPEEGGDPTSGQNAKVGQLDLKDFNVWDDHTK